MGEGLLQQLVGQGREAGLLQLLGEVESEAQLRFSNRKDLHLEACLTALFPKVCDMGELVVGKSMGGGGPRSLGSGGPRSHCNYLLVAPPGSVSPQGVAVQGLQGDSPWRSSDWLTGYMKTSHKYR